MADPRRAAVITGVSSGIGLGAAKVFVKHGWRVFGTVRSAADAERVAAEIGRPDAFTPLIADVTDQAAVAAAAEAVRAVLGGQRLGALVNNAGAIVMGPLLHATREEFQRQMARLPLPFRLPPVPPPLRLPPVPPPLPRPEDLSDARRLAPPPPSLRASAGGQRLGAGAVPAGLRAAAGHRRVAGGAQGAGHQHNQRRRNDGLPLHRPCARALRRPQPRQPAAGSLATRAQAADAGCRAPPHRHHQPHTRTRMLAAPPLPCNPHNPARPQCTTPASTRWRR
jgi:NAD(P)-dependent dehydrogenase (short-subunit alcohol dehydrogenase family)